jgi:peptide/nickel transport system substrate-binding protein
VTQFGVTDANAEDMIKVVDAMTLQFKANSSLGLSEVLSVLASWLGSIVDKETVLAHEQKGDRGNAWLHGNTAGSGPYDLRSWTPDEAAVLVANAAFRRPAAKLPRVVLRHVPEASAQRLLLEKGDVDIARDLTADQLAALASNKDIRIKSAPSADLYYLGLNLKDQRLANPQVRQALRYLIDYQGMADSFLKGRVAVHQTFFPSADWGAIDDTPYHLDVAKAKQLLAEAGYPDGFEIRMDTINSAPFSDIAQSLQQTLGAGGIKVTVVPAEQSQIFQMYRARNYQLINTWWTPNYVDPYDIAGDFARNPDNSDGAKVHTRAWRHNWVIPELTAFTERAVIEPDEGKRRALWAELQRKLLQDSPYLMMFQANTQIAMRSNVKDMIFGPDYDYYYYSRIAK